MNSQSAPIQPLPCWQVSGTFGNGTCDRLPAMGHCRHCPELIAAGRRLFDRAMPPGLSEETTNILAEAKESAPLDLVSILLYRLGSSCFALRMAAMEEVLAPSPVHTLPGRSTNVFLGLANINGILLPYFALRNLLGIAEHESTPPSEQRFLVIRYLRDRFVLVVDKVLGAQSFRSAELRESPAFFDELSRSYMAGIFDWQNQDVALFDEAKLSHILKKNLH